MQADFTLHVITENHPGLLSRMIGIFNRKRIYIKSMRAAECADDHDKGSATFVVHTTEQHAARCKTQLERIVEVESVEII